LCLARGAITDWRFWPFHGANVPGIVPEEIELRIAASSASTDTFRIPMFSSHG